MSLPQRGLGGLRQGKEERACPHGRRQECPSGSPHSELILLNSRQQQHRSPSLPLRDAPDNSLWGCSLEFPMGMFPGILSGDVPENSLWGCSREFSMGMLPKIPPGDAPDNSLWGCSRPFPLALYPQGQERPRSQQAGTGISLPFPAGSCSRPEQEKRSSRFPCADKALPPIPEGEHRWDPLSRLLSPAHLGKELVRFKGICLRKRKGLERCWEMFSQLMKINVGK